MEKKEIISQDYIPTGPWILKSGRYQGVSLEELMFHNYDHICAIYSYALQQRSTSSYRQHFVMLMKASNKLQTVHECGYQDNELAKPCKNLIQYFGFSTPLFGQTSEICSLYTRCKTHKDSLLFDGKWTAYPIAFSSLLKLSKKYQKKELLDLIKFSCNIQAFDAEYLYHFFFNQKVFPCFPLVKMEKQLSLF